MHEDLLSLKQQLLQTGFPEQLVKLRPQKAQVAWREAGDASSRFCGGAAAWHQLQGCILAGWRCSWVTKARVLAWDTWLWRVDAAGPPAPADADYAQVLGPVTAGARRCGAVRWSVIPWAP